MHDTRANKMEEGHDTIHAKKRAIHDDTQTGRESDLNPVGNPSPIRAAAGGGGSECRECGRVACLLLVGLVRRAVEVVLLGPSAKWRSASTSLVVRLGDDRRRSSRTGILAPPSDRRRVRRHQRQQAWTHLLAAATIWRDHRVAQGGFKPAYRITFRTSRFCPHTLPRICGKGSAHFAPQTLPRTPHLALGGGCSLRSRR